MKNNTMRWWIWGAVILAVVILGVWWWSASTPAVSDTASDISTSTPDTSMDPALPVVTESRTSSTVNGVIASLSNESRFAGLLSSTGVSSLIAGKGPYTVFVPTDASFGQLPTGTINNLTAVQLKRLVEYHIISGKEIDVNAQQAGTVQALSKDMLNFSVLSTDKSARVNSSLALYEYKTSNGIVYVIGTVLLPPLPPQN